MIRIRSDILSLIVPLISSRAISAHRHLNDKESLGLLLKIPHVHTHNVSALSSEVINVLLAQ